MAYINVEVDIDDFSDYEILEAAIDVVERLLFMTRIPERDTRLLDRLREVLKISNYEYSPSSAYYIKSEKELRKIKEQS